MPCPMSCHASSFRRVLARKSAPIAPPPQPAFTPDISSSNPTSLTLCPSPHAISEDLLISRDCQEVSRHYRNKTDTWTISRRHDAGRTTLSFLSRPREIACPCCSCFERRLLDCRKRNVSFPKPRLSHLASGNTSRDVLCILRTLADLPRSPDLSSLIVRTTAPSAGRASVPPRQTISQVPSTSASTRYRQDSRYCFRACGSHNYRRPHSAVT